MEDNLFKYFTTDNTSGKKCTEKWLSKNNINLYNDIIDWCNNINILKNIEFKRKVYHYINKIIDIPMCPVCGGKLNYRRIIDGYSNYCSDNCVKNSLEYKEKWKSSWKKNNSDGESIRKRNNTVIKKYGSIEEYNNKITEIIKRNNFNKHGVEYIFQTEEFKNKRKNTLNNKYGNDTFNNPNKTKETRIKNGTQMDDLIINNFKKYKIIVSNRTNTIYRNNKKIINPNYLDRSGKSNHLDHKFSIKQGYLNNLPIEIITHPCNLECIDYMDNLVKQDNCSITLEKLLNDIIEFEHDIKFTHDELKEKYKDVKIISLDILNEKINIKYDNK